MTTTTITSKGQIVIPSRIRKHLNIKPGMRFVVQEQGNKIIVEHVDRHYFDQFAGILKGDQCDRRIFKGTQAREERENKKWLKS